MRKATNAQTNEDLQLCQEVLFAQPGESLAQAAARVIRRSKNFGIVTRRTQVAYLVMREEAEDKWGPIKAAAEFWRRV